MSYKYGFNHYDSYRSISSKDIVCGICGNPPGPNGIVGWIFDLNLISCLECRKPKEITKDQDNKGEVCAPKKSLVSILSLDWFRNLFKNR